MSSAIVPVARPQPPAAEGPLFGQPRDPLGNRFVYVAISPRARGLSIGVNLSPERQCNFNCAYCEVDRRHSPAPAALDLNVLASELQITLANVRSGALASQAPYSRLPAELQRLRHVAISGDGEPTLCPQFREAIETVTHVRATARDGFFKIVLITNASNLDAPHVQEGLRLLTRDDEIWAKLDVGSQAAMDRLNLAQLPLGRILENILLLARQRPVVIQSLFPSMRGCAPSELDIVDYAARLRELKEAGAQISLVQIYSATRPTVNSDCGHLPLRTLSRIAQTVRQATGLSAEVF